MQLNRYYLGELITQRREKNPGGELPIRGVSKAGLQPPKQIEADTSIYNLYYRNDFVYNPARMELGSIAFNDEYDKAICSSLYEIFYVHRTDLILPEYLALFVKHPEFARYCNYLGNGSAREYCRFDSISRIAINLPSIEEQSKVVHNNIIITDRITILRKIADNLEAQIINLYCDFISSSVENGWKETTLGEQTSFISRGITPMYDDGSEEVVLNQKCIRGHTVDFSFSRRHIPKVVSDKWVQYGDLLINSTGAGTLGRTAIALFDMNNVTVDSHVTIVRAKAPELIYYIGIWGMTHELEIEGLQEGSTGQTELPRDRLINMPFVVPNIDELERFNNIVRPYFKMRLQYQKEIDVLQSALNTIVNSLGVVKGA